MSVLPGLPPLPGIGSNNNSGNTYNFNINANGRGGNKRIMKLLKQIFGGMQGARGNGNQVQTAGPLSRLEYQDRDGSRLAMEFGGNNRGGTTNNFNFGQQNRQPVFGMFAIG